MSQVATVQISNVVVEESKELSEIVEYMKKYGVKNPIAMLPSAPTYRVDFSIKNSFTGFANAIRRVLVGEIPTHGLNVNEKDIETDDDFILSDVVIKNINLTIINQDIADYPKNLSLYAYNDTNDVIDVTTKYIQIGAKPAKDSSGKSANNVITHNNIALFSLRPSKFVCINNIFVHKGISSDDAGAFSLLSNVSYRPVGVEPYNQFTKKGKRSIETTPTEFDISFTTAGNIKPTTVIKRVYDVLWQKLQSAKANITRYSDEKTSVVYYENFEVTTDKENLYKYVFHGEYFTLVNWLSQQCYKLDGNITHCSSTVERYDNEHGIIKLKHPNPNELLLKAISECEKDLTTFVNAFKAK